MRELTKRGAHVRALVRGPESPVQALACPGHGAAPVEVVRGSLGDGRVEEELVAGCDVVVHAAGALRGAASTLVRQNVIATRRLVGAATSHAVRRFVLVSSLAVYDTSRLRPGVVLDETCPLDVRPEERTPYVYSKIVQEQVCWDCVRAQRLPLVVVRPGVIFGPGRSCLTDRAGPRIGNWIAVIGPSRPLPYTFVENCARAVALAATAPAEISGGSINVVDDELPTGRELVLRSRRAGEAVRGVPVPAAWAPALSHMFARVHRWSDGMLPPFFVPRVVDAMYKPLEFSNARAKRLLGWQPAIDLETAFGLTFGPPR